VSTKVDGLGGIRVLDAAAILDHQVRREVFALSDYYGDDTCLKSRAIAHDQTACAYLYRAVLPVRPGLLVQDAVDVVAVRLIAAAEVLFNGNQRLRS
jgi:hypothetical protein